MALMSTPYIATRPAAPWLGFQGLAEAALRRLPGRPTALAPSLYDAHPWADSLPHAPMHLETVSSDDVVGTVRHPSTVDPNFIPLKALRTRHWQFRFGRVLEAMESLVELPPVELLKAGRHYYVVDGHNRVAAAKRLGADIDAHVTEILVPARQP